MIGRKAALGIALGLAIALMLGGRWVQWRREHVSPVTRPQERAADPEPAREPARLPETAAVAPPADTPAPAISKRRRKLPRFEVPAGAPSGPQSGHQLAKDNPRVLDAISGAAHSDDITEAEFRAGTQCIRDFAGRRPDLIDPTGYIRGAYLVAVETSRERGRVVGIQAKGGEDGEMFDCLRRSRVWLSGKPFPAEGAPDGTTTIEWPYRINTGKRLTEPPVYPNR